MSFYAAAELLMGSTPSTFEAEPVMRCASPSHDDPTKRFGTYFSSEVAAIFAQDDAPETWDYPEPNPICSRSSSPESLKKRNNTVSMAQEYAMKYREGTVPVTDLLSDTESWKSNTEEDTTLVNYDTDSDGEEEEMVICESDGPTLRHSESCQEILGHTYQEAAQHMEDADLTTSDALQCPRDGCDNMLKNVEALKMHLAIHEIAEEVDDFPYECDRCYVRYRTRRDLACHDCEEVEEMLSPPSSPIIDSFKNVISFVTAGAF